MPKPEEPFLIESVGCSAYNSVSVFDDHTPAPDVARRCRKGPDYRFGTLFEEDLYLGIDCVQKIQQERFAIVLLPGSNSEAGRDRDQVCRESGVIHVNSNSDKQNAVGELSQDAGAL